MKIQSHKSNTILWKDFTKRVSNFSFGAAVNFGTSHSKWSDYYPGLRSKLTSLNGNYYMPLSRELFLSCGFASASAESLTTMLNQSNDPNHKSNRDGYTSNAVGLIVGGMREQNITQPDTYKFVVQKRRGFVRIALQTGASLVPAISFGENNLHRMANCKSKSSVADQNTPNFALLCGGRGCLQYDYGLIPRRHPITTVIGAPIHLEKNANPSQENFDKVHDAFCTHLYELFETHKSTYMENSDDIHLEFVWKIHDNRRDIVKKIILFELAWTGHFNNVSIWNFSSNLTFKTLQKPFALMVISFL